MERHQMKTAEKIKLFSRPILSGYSIKNMRVLWVFDNYYKMPLKVEIRPTAVSNHPSVVIFKSLQVN